MKNKILTLLLIGATLVSCSKEEIEPKQCWKFNTTVRVTYSVSCRMNNKTINSTSRSCNLTKTEAEQVARDIDAPNNFKTSTGSCTITSTSKTTFFAN